MNAHDNAADECCRRIVKMFIHNRSPDKYLNTDTGNGYFSLFFRTATHLVTVWLILAACNVICFAPVSTVMQEYAWVVFIRRCIEFYSFQYFGQRTTLVFVCVYIYIWFCKPLVSVIRSGFPKSGEPNGRVRYRELISFKKVSDWVTLLIEFLTLRHAKWRKEFHFSECLVFIKRRKRRWKVSKVNVSLREAHLSKALKNKRGKVLCAHREGI
jgi:hypothetical protein